MDIFRPDAGRQLELRGQPTEDFLPPPGSHRLVTSFTGSGAGPGLPREQGAPSIIKGPISLAASKGRHDRRRTADQKPEAAVHRAPRSRVQSGAARVVIEEFHDGEASFIVISRRPRTMPMATSQDLTRRR